MYYPAVMLGFAYIQREITVKFSVHTVELSRRIFRNIWLLGSRKKNTDKMTITGKPKVPLLEVQFVTHFLTSLQGRFVVMSKFQVPLLKEAFCRPDPVKPRNEISTKSVR